MRSGAASAGLVLDEAGGMSAAQHADADSAAPAPIARAPRLAIGSWVRVDSEERSVSWTGHISYLNGEILGLRGATSAEDLFALRDKVTVSVGRGATIASSQARVLAASGRMLRVLIRRAVGDMERRRATRIRVTQPVSVCRINGCELDEFAAELVDLSALGCAVRSDTSLAPSDRVSIAMNLDDTAIQVVGEVVRTWRSEALGPLNAGVHFDAITPRQESLIRRFLVGQLRLLQSR
jgi:PilZ domain